MAASAMCGIDMQTDVEVVSDDDACRREGKHRTGSSAALSLFNVDEAVVAMENAVAACLDGGPRTPVSPVSASALKYSVPHPAPGYENHAQEESEVIDADGCEFRHEMPGREIEAVGHEGQEQDFELPDRRALKTEAKRHRAKTACTTYNSSTGEYVWYPYWMTTPKQMGSLGVGVQLYFQLLKQFGWVFVLLIVLSIPMMFLNLAGSMVEDASILNSIFGRFSIANLGNCPKEGCHTFEDMWGRCSLTFEIPGVHPRTDDSCDLQVKDVTQWLGLLDGIGILVVMGFCIYFVQLWIPSVVRQTDEANSTPADYTVWVPYLPKYLPDPDDHAIYAQKLKEHFLEILASFTTNPITDESAIEDVSLVHEYDGAIMKFTTKGKHLQEQENVRVLHQIALAKGKEKAAARHWKRIHQLDSKIRNIDKALRTQAKKTDEDRGVCSAFVTFSEERIRRKVLKEYRFARHPLFRLCQSARMQFAGHRISVVEACEPTDLYWENLDYDYWKRLMRKGFVLVLTILVLIVCSAIIASLESISPDIVHEVRRPTWIIALPQSDVHRCLDVCNFELYTDPKCSADSMVSMSSPGVRLFSAAGNISSTPTATCANSWQSPGCKRDDDSKHDAWFGVDFESPKAIKCMKLVQQSANFSSTARVYACPSGIAPTRLPDLRLWDPSQHCQAMELVHPTLASSSGALELFPDQYCASIGDNYIPIEVASRAKQESAGNTLGDPTFNCFCKQQARRNTASFISPPYDTPAEELCMEWSQDMAKMYAKMAGAVVLIAILNQVLLIIYSYFIAWERLCTVTELLKSQLVKLFLSQFVNTGLIMFLVNLSIKKYPDFLSFIKVLSIGEGSYHDLTSQWFIVVGTTLALTILIEVVSTTIPPLIMCHIVNPLQQKYYIRTKVTQESLNEVYTLPEWKVALRLAQTLNVIFCVLMYSGGMPILYLVGAVYCLVAFWMDKWCLLRGSQRPPAYTQDVIILSVEMVPFAAFLHTAITGWTFGNQALFPSDWSKLRPLMEKIVGMDLARYSQVTEAYRLGTEEGITGEFLQSKFLDFSREGTWLLLLIFLVASVYFLVVYLYHFLLKPFLSPVVFLAWEAGRKMARSCVERCGRTWDEEERPSISWQEAKMKNVELLGGTFSYHLADNPKYRAAYKALLHTTDCIKSQTARSDASKWVSEKTNKPDPESRLLDGTWSSEKTGATLASKFEV